MSTENIENLHQGERTLRTAEMRTLKAIRRVTWRDKVRNEQIKDRDIQDIVRWIEVRRRGWRNHMERMDSEKLAKRATTQKPQSTHSLGDH